MSLCVSVWMCVNYECERIQVSMWECVRNVCYEYVTAHVFLHIHLWLHLPTCSGTRMGCKCHMCDTALSCSSLFTLFLWVPLCEVEKDQGSVLVISLIMSPGKCLHLLWPEQPDVPDSTASQSWFSWFAARKPILQPRWPPQNCRLRTLGGGQRQMGHI